MDGDSNSRGLKGGAWTWKNREQGALLSLGDRRVGSN